MSYRNIPNRYGVVDGAEEAHHLPFLSQIYRGFYKVNGTHLLIEICGINSDGSPLVRYYFGQAYSDRVEIPIEQFFEMLPPNIKSQVIFHFDLFV